MGRLWSYWWRGIVALLALWLVGMKGAQQVKWIGPDPFLEFWLVMGAGILVFSDNVYAIYQLYRRPAIGKQRRKMERILLACLRTLGQNPAADTFSLGASVYLYQRRSWPFQKYRPLKRIRRYRLAEYPQESIVSWTDAKGVVGKAGRERLPQHADWTKIAPRWNEQGSSVQDYEALPEDEKWGFTFEEFHQVASKYVEALAVPIMNHPGNKVLGVLAVDVPYWGGGKDYTCVLKSDDAKRVVTTCAASLREIFDGG